MANKAAVQALIDAIGNGQPNTAAEARSAWNSLMNELYSTPVKEETSGTPTITTAASGFQYALIFKKSGNEVSVSGWIKNNTGSMVSSTNVLSFSDTAYNSRTSFNTECPIGDGRIIRFVGNNIYLPSALSAYEKVYFSHTYPTND